MTSVDQHHALPWSRRHNMNTFFDKKEYADRAKVEIQQEFQKESHYSRNDTQPFKRPESKYHPTDDRAVRNRPKITSILGIIAIIT